MEFLAFLSLFFLHLSSFRVFPPSWQPCEEQTSFSEPGRVKGPKAGIVAGTAAGKKGTNSKKLEEH